MIAFGRQGFAWAVALWVTCFLVVGKTFAACDCEGLEFSAIVTANGEDAFPTLAQPHGTVKLGEQTVAFTTNFRSNPEALTALFQPETTQAGTISNIVALEVVINWNPGENEEEGYYPHITGWGLWLDLPTCGYQLQHQNSSGAWVPIESGLLELGVQSSFVISSFEPGSVVGEGYLRIIPLPSDSAQLEKSKGIGNEGVGKGKAAHGDEGEERYSSGYTFESGVGIVGSEWGGSVSFSGNLWELLGSGSNQFDLSRLGVLGSASFATANDVLSEVYTDDSSVQIEVISADEFLIKFKSDHVPENGTEFARHTFTTVDIDELEIELEFEMGFGEVAIPYPCGMLRVEDPDGALGNEESLSSLIGAYELTEFDEQSQEDVLIEYAWARKSWKDGSPNKYVMEEVFVEWINGDRIVTHWKGGSEIPLLKTVERYHLYSWGEELVERVIDPTGANRRTTFAYYENAQDIDSFRRLRRTESYVGAVVSDWRYYTYASEAAIPAEEVQGKAISFEYGPWLSMSPPGADPTTNALQAGVETERWRYIGASTATVQSATIVRVQGEETSRRENVVASFLKGVREYTGGSSGEDAEFLFSASDDTYTYRTELLTDLGSYGAQKESARWETTSFIIDFDAEASPPEVSYTGGTDKAVDSYSYQLPALEDKSTMTRTLSVEGKGVIRQTYVWVDPDNQNFQLNYSDLFAGYELMTTEISVVDTDGRTIEVWKDGMLVSETSYSPSQTVSSGVDGSEDVTNLDGGGNVESTVYDGITESTQEVLMGNNVKKNTTRSAGGRTLSSHTLTNRLGELVEMWDEAGMVTTYATAMDEGLVMDTLTYPNGSTIVTKRHMDGKTESVTGTGVVARHMVYEVLSNGNLETITFIGANPSTNYQIGVIDHAGRVVSSTVSSPEGDLTTTYAYDSYGNRSAVTRPDGSIERFEYDALGGLKCRWLDRPSSGGQPADDQKVLASMDEITDYSEGYVEFSGVWYTSRIISQYLGNDSDTKSTVSSFHSRVSYDASSGLIGETFSINADSVLLTERTYVDRSAKSRRSVSFYGSSAKTAESQWLNGRLVSSRDLGADAPSLYGYDGFGRVTSVSDPATGRRKLSHYNDAGQLDYETDFAGNPTRYEYYVSGSSGAGQTHRVVNADGKDSIYTYNLRGQVTSVRGSAEYPVDYGYHATYGWRTSMTTYRSLGGAGNTTYWDYYVESGQLKWKRDARNDPSKQVSYEYDGNGRVAVRTWARGGRATGYSYDSVGRLSGIDYDGTDTPDVTGMKYDRGGRLMNVTDAAGTRTLTYRTSGDEVSDTLAAGSGILAGYEVVHGYGSGFNTSLIVNEGTTKRYQVFRNWDADYRRLNAISFLGPNLFTTMRGKVDFDYAPGSGRKEAQRFRRGIETTDRFKTSFVPDLAGRLGSIRTKVVSTGFTASAHSYRFDSLNRRVRAIREDGSFWAYNYNDRGELAGAEKHLRGDDYPLAGHQWEYAFDDIGNRLSMKSGGDASGNNLRTTTYGSGAKGGSANLLNQYEAISNPSTFDIVGTDPNVLGDGPEDPVAINIGEASLDGQPLSAQPKTHYRFNVPANNGSGPSWQDITVTDSSGAPHAAGGHYSPAATQTIGSTGYDDDGNLVNDGRWNYTWNCENRLIAMETTTAAATAGVPRTRLQFAYDYLGRRIEKKVYLDTGSGFPGTPDRHEKFIYEGWNVLLRLDANSSNGIIQEYYWGPDLSGTFAGAGGVGGLLAVAHFDSPGTTTTPDGFHYVCYDGNGNVAAMLKAADDSVTARYDYDGFGNLVAAEGDFVAKNPFRFSTKYADAESGLIYYGFRYYNSNLGRWISCDPIEERGGVNLFGFVYNNSTNVVDVLGREPSPEKESEIVEIAPISGADVTKAVRKTLLDVDIAFNLASAGDQCRACQDLSSLFTVAYRYKLDPYFWDIYELRERFPISGWAGSGRLHDGTGGEQLVTIEGQVHRLYSVNYALWGKMFETCHRWAERPKWYSSNITDTLYTEDYAVGLTALYKTIVQEGKDYGRSPVAIEEAGAFVKYGYSGTLPGDDAIAGVVKPSTVEYPDGTMDWVWAPYITEKRLSKSRRR